MYKKDLNSNNSASITTDYTHAFQKYDKKAFAEFIREKRTDHNETNGTELSTEALGEMLGISYEMFRKILNQQKPTKKRDCIIAICAALNLAPDEVDLALNLYNYMPSLDPYSDRDFFIISQLDGRSDLTVNELNHRLLQAGFQGLDIIDKRNGRKKGDSGEPPSPLPYEVIEIKIRTPVKSEFYYSNPYDSLRTEYDPGKYDSIGEMLLRDLKKKKRLITLTGNAHGVLFSYEYEEKASTIYKTLDETEEYKPYFIKLDAAITTEQQRLLKILNDTRNYQHRSSARLIGDSICIFSEEFNYSVPEMNEYYVLSFNKVGYELKVYNQSAFMSIYLSADEYRKYYGNTIPEPIESYDSVQQLDNLLKSVEEHSEEHFKYRLRKYAFNKLKKYVDDLYKKIKNREAFIQNLEYAFDNPADCLRVYGIEEAFGCIFDEYGEIISTNENANFSLPDGSLINITLSDIKEAFRLGFRSIEEICRIKKELGSVSAVMP